MFAQWIAFAMENILILVAGGALALWLAVAMFKKFESYFRSVNSWGQLVFFAAKSIAILIIMFYVARMIWTTANSAVTTAVNSGSIQGVAQLAVNVGQGLDYLASSSGNFEIPLPSGGPKPLLPTGGLTLDFAQSQMESSDNPIVAPTPIVVAALNEPKVESAEPATMVNYTVQSGDSMFKIAEKILGDGDRYLELCRANASVVGQDCSRIRRGMVLTLPSGTESQPLTEWKNAITDWQVAPLKTQQAQAQQWNSSVTAWTQQRTAPAPAQQWNSAVNSWTQPKVEAAPVAPTATPTKAPVVYGPAANPAEQATKDAATQWNVTFGN